MAINLESLDELQRERLRDMGFFVPGLPQRKPNKYRARKTEYKGVLYDSKAEADYAAELDALKFKGEVAWWLRQVKIPLGLDFSTRVDFLVAIKNHSMDSTVLHVYAVEVKGVETREFAKIRKLWTKYSPFDLHINKRGNTEVLRGAGE